MIILENIINQLDRKFNLVMSLESDAFAAALEDFVNLVQMNEVVRPYVDFIFEKMSRQEQSFHKELRIIVERLIEIKERLLERFPELYNEKDENFSSKQSTEDILDIYSSTDYSFANFDRISRDVYKKLQIESINEGYLIPHLLMTLRSKIPENTNHNFYQKLHIEIVNIEEEYIHFHRRVHNFDRFSAGKSLAYIFRLVLKPKQLASLEGLINQTFLDVLSDNSARPDFNNSFIEGYKVHLKLAYEGIRNEMGFTLSHRGLMRRYQARCMWYNKETLRSLTENSEQKEHALTKDLALFLFDNGLSTLYRLRKGAHEFDLVGDAKVASIFIEVKVYDDSKSRKGLLDGFAQLHAYLNAREADDVFMEEAYYVIYRLGGTLYDFPDKIHTNRHIIYILVIDLGESNDSGRKQPKPISIKRKDLISMIVRGRRGGTADRRRRWWGRDVRKRKGTL